LEIKEQYISLKGLRFYAFHGAEAQEAVVGGWFTVDVTIQTDATVAVESDDLKGTINYASVVAIVKEQMQIRSALLENVAGRIAQSVLDAFGSIKAVTVTVGKEHPPVDVSCSASSFTLTASK
jgi:dihydroneopterin aldolase